MSIHPTAIVAADADIDPSAEIGPYVIIGANVRIGAVTVIDSHARIDGPTIIGRGNRIGHGATLGCEPQDIGFRVDHPVPLTIGDHNHIREFVNISRGVKTTEGTRVGDHNYLMAFSHIGHDCQVGHGNVLANTATLAGHVIVGDHAFVSGHVAVHQFCRIGDYCMIGGQSGVSQDILPFALANGQRARVVGLNIVGLRRHGFDAECRARIKAVYQLLFRSRLRLVEAVDAADHLYPGPETARILAFIRAGHAGRGLATFRRPRHDVVEEHAH